MISRAGSPSEAEHTLLAIVFVRSSPVVPIDDEIKSRRKDALRLIALVEIEAIVDFQVRIASSRVIDQIEVYSRAGTSAHFERRVHWQLSVIGIDVAYNTIYECDRSGGRISWFLDPDRENDIRRAVGEYVLEPSPTRTGFVRLHYDFEVASSHEASNWLRRQLAKRNVRSLLDDIRTRAERSSP